MSEFKDLLASVFEQGGIEMTDTQKSQMAEYFDCLIRENAKYNITAITKSDEAALKHFLDSVQAAEILPQNAKVIDVGSGGGFPIAPLKILRPDISAFALEATGKKCRFIELAAKEVGIDIVVLNTRAEDAAHSNVRASFDVCVSRAVADLPVLLELCAGLVKRGGLVACYKGEAAEEITRSENAEKMLGLKLLKVIIPKLAGQVRSIPVYEKIATTPNNYPRMFSQINKSPL